MITGIFRRVGPFVPLALAAFAPASPLIQRATYSLDPALSIADVNRFHPQGLGFDDLTHELLFVQQTRTNPVIVRTDVTGSILGTVKIGDGGDAPGSFAVSVAADAGNYYFSDYYANAQPFGRDVYSVSRPGGTISVVGSEFQAAYGTPLDVRGGGLYRTEPTPGNVGSDSSYAGLSTVRVSNVANPDTILRTLNLNTPGGIGDFTVDLPDNSLYVLSYAQGDIYRYDLTTGAQLDFYDLNLQSASAGIAFGDGSLYYYDWQEGAGSQLRVYSTPEPASCAALAFGVFGLLRRRRKA